LRFGRIFEKHCASYERYLPKVLALREAECADCCQQPHIEHEIETQSLPQIAGRRAELARLTVELNSAREESMASDHRVRELEQALEQARAEIDKFRSSWSWRLTAPLRQALDLWFAVRRALRSGHLPPA
jgi:chromosome segregation ATPase